MSIYQTLIYVFRHGLVNEILAIQTDFYYPPASKASRDVAILTER